MSIKEKFEEICGTPLEFDFFDSYIITLDAAGNCALIDVDKFTKVTEWLPFLVSGLPKEGTLRYKHNSFNLYFVNKALDVLNPNEYALYSSFNVPDQTEDYILALRNGNYGIIIAPMVDIEDVEKPGKEYYLMEYIKEAPKSVFVI